MAGKPKTREAFGRILDAGGEDRVFTEVAKGRTLNAIAAELAVSRPILSQWCLMPSRRAAYMRAREIAQARRSGIKVRASEALR